MGAGEEPGQTPQHSREEAGVAGNCRKWQEMAKASGMFPAGKVRQVGPG